VPSQIRFGGFAGKKILAAVNERRKGYLEREEGRRKADG